jgi:chaperonin GroES
MTTKKAKTTVQPIGDHVLVKRLEAEAKSAGGIVLPDTAKEKPKEGRVIAVGDGKTLEGGKKTEFQVKKGDRVLFTSYAGTEITIEGQEYVVMSEDDILAVIE